MNRVWLFFTDLVRKAIEQSPTRFVAYTAGLAVAAALKIAEAVGITLSTEQLATVLAIATFVITELIRQFVYAPSTVQDIAIEAAKTGVPAIGSPPDAEPPLEPDRGD